MAKQIQTYITEINEVLVKSASGTEKVKAEKLKKYIGTNHQVIGLVSKSQGAINKVGFSFYSDSKEKSFLVFDKIYKSTTVFEIKNQAFIFLDNNYKHIALQTQLQLLPLWVKQVDNWAHSDTLSKYLTRLIENESTHAEMMNTIINWNSSTNLWERRQSIVPLFYYARTKKNHVTFETAQQLIFNLILDKEYFVQKAVGWALRESYNVYPKQTFQFIEENIKDISSAAFTTCLEKMTETEKLRLKNKRKK